MTVLRDEVRLRASGYCEYCRIHESFSSTPFQVDHVIAEKHVAKSQCSAYNQCMESITRNMSDISLRDKLALEQVIGHSLSPNQQVIIQICDPNSQPHRLPDETKVSRSLPEWCNVYAGLSDEQIDSIEQTVLQRANLTRTTE